MQICGRRIGVTTQQLGIVKAIALSRAAMRNIRQNLFFAFVYNALAFRYPLEFFTHSRLTPESDDRWHSDAFEFRLSDIECSKTERIEHLSTSTRQEKCRARDG
jgi:hypothetical protein